MSNSFFIQPDNLIKLLFMLCFVMTSNFLIAQSSLKNQCDFAFKLFEQEEYYQAITEFKRLQYFDSLKQYSFPAKKFIGLCYKHGGKFTDAIKYLSLAELETSNIDSLFDIRIEIIKTNLLRRTVYRAFDLLNDLNSDERFNRKKNEIIYWTGWAFIFNDDWEKASDEFTKLDSNHELSNLCRNVADEHYSKTKAKIFSYILPWRRSVLHRKLFKRISLAWMGNSLDIYFGQSFFSRQNF